MMKPICYQLFYTQSTGKKVTLCKKKNGQDTMYPSFLNNEPVAI